MILCYNFIWVSITNKLLGIESLFAVSIIIFKMTSFKCDICDLSFQTKCGIRVHKKSKHLGITWNKL